MTKNRNKNIILTVLLGLALVLSLWTASGGSWTGVGVNNTTATTDSAVANLTDHINVTFEIGNMTSETWKINVTSVVKDSYNNTITSPDWINLTIATGSDTSYASFNNTSFVNGTFGTTHVLLLNSTKSTLGTFDVKIENVNNSLENVTITGLSFIAGPPAASGMSFINDTSAVANNTDTQDMKVLVKDAFGNPIANREVTLSSNRTEDTITSTSVTTDSYGNASFTVKSTLAGTADITAAITDTMTTNQTQEVMFVAGPAYKLAIFGPNGSAPATDTIKQWIAVQDANSNNVSYDSFIDYQVTRTLNGDATSSPTTMDFTLANFTSLAANGANYSGTFEKANMTITDATDEVVTLTVYGNASLKSASKSLTFYGSVSRLAVSTNASDATRYANSADDILVTVQLQDSGSNNILTSGVSVALASASSELFTFPGATVTNANGIATFVVSSTNTAGSGTIIATSSDGNGESETITFNPALDVSKCDVVNSTLTTNIIAGGTSTITATVRDAANDIMANYPVTFNLTTGDGTVGGLTLYTTTTNANGNATAIVTSTNASTTLTVNVTAQDQNGVAQQLDLQNFDVDPNVVNQISVSPGISVGLKNEVATTQPFTLQYQDAYGNNNSSTSTILITTDNTDLGLINNGTDYANNVIVAMTSGTGAFTYEVNSSTAGTAVLTLNATSYAGVVQPVTITTNDPTDLKLVFSGLYPLAGVDNVTATATLTDSEGNALAISGKMLTFTLTDASSTLLDINETVTLGTGQATYLVDQSTAGVYTVTVSNSSMGISATNTTTFVGAASSVVAAVNDSSVSVNDTVTVNATIKDSNGYITSDLNGQSVKFIVGGAIKSTAIVTNGVATTTYTSDTAGTVAINTFYNASLQDTVDVTFTDVATGTPALVCSVTPNSRAAQVGTPVTILMSVINYGTGTATDVSISQASSLAASVSYRPWDGVSAYTGPVDTPVDIAAGATANFVLIINATSAFSSSAMTFDVSGTNVAAAPVSGVNTLTLSASTVPSADVIMISTDTTVTSAVDAAKAFAVATTNVGNADATGVSFVVDVPTGITGLVYQVNETNLDGTIKGPATGLTIAMGDQPTFAVFVTATEAIVNDPTNNRITLKLVDVSGNVIGAQSIGIYTT